MIFRNHFSVLRNKSIQVKGGLQAINAADEEPLDEEAERLAFMRAVEEWRKGDAGTAQKKVTIVREFGGKPASSAISDVTTSHFSLVDGADSGGMWKNPFAPAEPSPRVSRRHLLIHHRSWK